MRFRTWGRCLTWTTITGRACREVAVELRSARSLDNLIDAVADALEEGSIPLAERKRESLAKAVDDFLAELEKAGCVPKGPRDYCAEHGYTYTERPNKCGSNDGGAKDGTGYDSWTDYAEDKCGRSEDDLGVKENPHGHHVVMKGKFPDLTEPAQQILCKYKIDPFCGCPNLYITQNRCHSKPYGQLVLDALQAADESGRGRSHVLSELARLAGVHAGCDNPNDPANNSDE